MTDFSTEEIAVIYLYRGFAGNMPLTIEGETIRFEMVGIGAGSVSGVAQTSDELGKKAIEQFGKLGVKKITQDEYERFIAPRYNATFTRAVDAMDNISNQQPEPVVAAKTAVITEKPAAVVKIGKAKG